MAQDDSITHNDDGEQGDFRLGEKAEMTYVYDKPGVIDVNHTWTDPSLRGQGIAGRLFEAMVAFARRENLKVIPSCPYVAAKFRNQPELSGLLARN